MNVSFLRQAKARQTRACGPAEVAPGVWVKIDCHKYTAIKSARPHWAAHKARAMTKVVRSNVRIVAHPRRGGADRAGAPTATADKSDFPDVVDHRTQGLEGPIKNQGYVGSCTAFSLSSAMDNVILRAKKTDVMSPTHVWAHYGLPSMEAAGDGNLNKMIASFETWPYTGKEGCELSQEDDDDCGGAYHTKPNSAKSDPQLQAHLAKAESTGLHKLVAYEMLARPFAVDELKSVLAGGSDLWIAMMVGESWMGHSVKDGVITDWDDVAGGHAIVMSGYRKLPSGKHQFLIHNSWGESWADHGYGWINESMVGKWMDYAYKLKLDEGGAPVGETTDDDCAMDELLDAVTFLCARICPDEGRRASGKCGGK